MANYNLGWLVLVGILVTLGLPYSHIHTAVFPSPKFVLRPGSVENKFYFNVDFPRSYCLEKFRCRKVGNPAELPSGFKEQRMLNVHAIDTRGAKDKLGCTECRCDLYNVTVDEYERPLRPCYKGGLLCCYDRIQYSVKHGFEAVRRTFYLRYTEKWIDMDRSILPVKIYIFDITDSWKRTPSSTGINAEHKCKTEYDIESCDATGLGNDRCIDTKRISLDMLFDGYLIYGWPTYEEGEEPGNEAGYIVEMTTYYPQPGTVEISKGETLILESNYSRIRHNTGVMGLFYILIADELPKPMHTFVQTQDNIMVVTMLWAAAALMGVVAIIDVVVHYRLKRKGEDGYEAIGM
ncbi:hypothetical protein GOBAR_AA35639 [Gossypium barbadense]|uniref:Uncharacterized protein n=1 Tax=Gossypium barbadense TaxID=3634 RepID=A0A2P5W1W6_GOSBA|nr:hypothetical protein GOBAR_AA35639 [Gossypium barbadense]